MPSGVLLLLVGEVSDIEKRSFFDIAIN